MIFQRIYRALKRQDWWMVGFEFVLLVAGVLLALMLDQWILAQKGNKLYEAYLLELDQDLKRDIAIADFGYNASLKTDKMADYFLDVIEGRLSQPVDPEELVEATLVGGYAYLPSPKRTTFDELLSTGNLRLFKDPKIKRSITEYYALMTGMSQWNVLIRSIQTDYRREIRNLLDREQYRWARVAATRGKDRPTFPPFDLDRFLKTARSNEDLIGVVSAMAEVQERLRRDSVRMGEQAKTLRSELKDR